MTAAALTAEKTIRVVPRPTTRIAVQSGRGLFREGVIELLRQHGCEARGYASHADLLLATRRGLPDLVLLDLEDGTGDPREHMRELRARWPEATVVAIGTPRQLAAQAPTADGWVEQPGAGARDVFAIAEAVSEARQGRIRLPIPPGVERQLAIWESLTRRQRQVLGLLGCGLANPKIAAALGVSERAVKVHVSSLLEKFSVDNRTGLALIACLAGFPFVQLASDTNQLTLGLR